MKYKILISQKFKRNAKPLHKKYASLKNEIGELVSQLESNPVIGSSLGNDCYKIRLAIKSKGKGKSGGARVITYVLIINEEVFLLTIYDKSEKESISITEINDLINNLDSE